MKPRRYSDYVEGDKSNLRAFVRFDLDDAGLGIASFTKGTLTDRVLLTPPQMRVLLKFIHDNLK